MKKIPFIIISLFFAAAVFSQEIIKSLVVITESKNLTAGESAWLPENICDKLESNFQTYTNYEMISYKEKVIRDYQKKSETVGFDENTAIEAGKMVSASHIILLTVSKAGKTYSVTAGIVNSTTNKLIAKHMISGKSNPEELFSTAGCAADEITIELCDQLGVPLSGAQRYILKSGDMNISDSEKLAMFNQEITNYNKQIAELDKEINLLAQSTDLDATTKKAKLEAEKALAEEKRKVTEAEKIRLAEIEKAKAEEQIKHTEREEEQQKRISEVSQEANKRAAELRNLKMANQSSLGVLRVIEAKKAALIEIRENVENEQAAIAQSIEKEYNTKIDALNNTLWRKSQTLADNKTPTEKAKRERAEEIEKLRIECINKIETEQNRIKNATKASQNEIYNEISTDLKTLGEKIFYANTLDRNLRMTIGEYDGNKESWEVKYSVLSDGVELYTGYSEIKYADLEKLKPSKMTYDDAVDMYDSLFKLNEPVLTFEISYKIEPVKDLISTYEYEFHRLEAFDTTSIKNTNSSALSGNSFLCSGSAKKVYKEILPGYDFRTEEEKQKIANAKRIEDEKRRKQEEKRQRKLEQKREIKDSLGNMVRLGIEGNFSSGYFILDYGTRWMLGGGGAVEINYVTTHKWGFGLIFDVSYLHSITEEAELNFLPISFHFLVEKHIPVKTGPLFVIRPRGTIGMGGSSYWKDDTPEGKELSYFLLITTLGCYFDFYNSNKFVAFYFGPSIRASLAVSDENPIPAIGLLQPSFSVGVKFNYMAK